MTSWSGTALERFEVEQMLGTELAWPGLVPARQNDLSRLPARHGVAETMTNHAEVVLELGFELELFHGRDAHVMRRLGHLDDRRLVPGHVGDDLGGELVGAPFAVDQLDLEALRIGELERWRGRHGAVLRSGRQRDHLALLRRPASRWRLPC